MNKGQAWKVVKVIKVYFKEQGYEVPDAAWFFADHDHEGLSEGSWSLACEAYLPYEWTIEVASDAGVRSKIGDEVLLEPINNCILAICEA